MGRPNVKPSGPCRQGTDRRPTAYPRVPCIAPSSPTSPNLNSHQPHDFRHSFLFAVTFIFRSALIAAGRDIFLYSTLLSLSLSLSISHPPFALGSSSPHFCSLVYSPRPPVFAGAHLKLAGTTPHTAETGLVPDSLPDATEIRVRHLGRPKEPTNSTWRSSFPSCYPPGDHIISVVAARLWGPSTHLALFPPLPRARRIVTLVGSPG